MFTQLSLGNLARSLKLGGFLFCVVLSCLYTAQAAGVTLSASPTSRTVNAGQSTSYTVNINRDGYAGSLTLSAANLPAGATATFNPNPTTAKSSILTVTTKTTTPTGTFQIRVSGIATGITIAPVNVSLTVRPTPSVAITVVPETQSIIAGQSVDYSIRLERTNYDSPVTLSAANLPEGVTASFEPNPIYSNAGSMRLNSNAYFTRTGNYQFEIIATAQDFTMRRRVSVMVNCNTAWSDQFGTNQSDYAYDVITDASGNTYVVGDSFNPANNTADVWVAKYDRFGTGLWFTPFGTSGEDRATEVAVDGAGNVFVGGHTNGTFANPGFPNQTNQGGYDWWIAKFDASGNPQWGGARQSGTMQEDGKSGFEIIPDGNGGAKFVTFENNRTGVLTVNVNSNGNISSVSSFGLSNTFQGRFNDLAVGSNGDVYLAGWTETVGQGDNSVVVKLDSQGNGVWTQQSSLLKNERARRIVVDSSGNAFAAGEIAEVVPIGQSAPPPDAWVSRYDAATGNVSWTAFETTPAKDEINGLALNSAGDVIIAGMTEGVLGEQNGGGNVNATRFDDAWVSRRRGSDGSLMWVRQFPVADIDGFSAVAVNSNDGILLAGYTVAFKSRIGFEDALLVNYSDFTRLNITRITGLMPNSGRVGDVIRINGTFLSSVTGVRFNGVAAGYSVVSSNAIDATVPSGAMTGLVTVSTGCYTASSPMQFTVMP